MSVLASDTFVRANNADLGTAWDECTGESSSGGFDISANTAIPALTASDSSETNNSVSWPNDQYSQVTHSTTTANGVGAGSGPTCRAATGATRTYYRLVGNASGYEFGRKVAAAYTALSSGTGTTFTSGDTLYLEVKTNGANADWICKKNGTSFDSGTDTSPIASGRAGIAFSSTSTAASLSAWEGGDFAAGGAAARVPQSRPFPYKPGSPRGLR
jgi:hypothetical protein